VAFRDAQEELVATIVEAGNATMLYIFREEPLMALRGVLIDASYWRTHVALQRQGALRHDHKDCTDNDARTVRVWEPLSGWTEQVAQPLY
jgi:hypothetical protein